MPEPDIDVSVIVAVRNGAETLGQCIDSILGQEGCTVELIIVDAMSDDGTQQIIESYGDRIATYIREPDTGIYDAWNKALNVARGEWCSFLGADDWYLDGAIASLLSGSRSSPPPDVVFVYGGVIRTGALEDYVFHPQPQHPMEYLRSGRMLPHPGSLHRREMLIRVGRFDSSFLIAGDYDALLRLCSSGSVMRISEIVVTMRVGGVSNQRTQRGQMRSEVARVLAGERGRAFAEYRRATVAASECAGRGVEVVLLALLGSRRGIAVVKSLRKGLGRAPKLL